MNHKKRAETEFNFNNKSKSSKRCINCKYLDCTDVKYKKHKIFIKCSELSNYLGKLIFVGFNSICDLYKLGNK